MVQLQQFEDTQIRGLRRAEYDVLVERGVISEDERIELIDGMLVTMSPQSSEHAEIVSRFDEELKEALGRRARVRVQLPLAVSETSEPEPDIAVVPPGNYAKAHPTSAWLVIEIAVDSVRKDRILKSRVYGASGIPEYWLVNVPAREIEVYHEPHSEGYHSLKRYGMGERITCLQFPDVDIEVARLLV